MSKYTTQLRWVVEQSLDDLNLEHSEVNWPHVYKVLGLGDYPLFDEDYRSTLNDKIIRHYYTREIGAETVGRFRMFVRDAMHLIMPYYNQLYESELIAKSINPLDDKSMKSKEHAWGIASNKGTGESSGTSSTKVESGNQNVFQDTPQSEMIPDQIKNLQYATNVTLDEESSNTDGSVSNTSSTSSSGEYDNMVEKTEEGYSRSQSELLQIYRETFLNIDNDIVHDVELAQCFMTIW